jgi:hypothetical protein
MGVKFVIKKSKKKTPPAPPEVVDAVIEAPATMRGAADSEKRHLPVVQSVRSPAQSMGLPPLACSTCTMGVECTEYQEGYVCAYEERFSSFGKTRDLDEIEASMYEVVGDTLRRYKMSVVQEKVISGGAISPETTALGQVAMSQMRQLTEMRRVKQTVTLTTETTKKGGLLSELFGGGAKTEVSNSVELNPPGVDTVEEPTRQVVTVELTQEKLER